MPHLNDANTLKGKQDTILRGHEVTNPHKFLKSRYFKYMQGQHLFYMRALYVYRYLTLYRNRPKKGIMNMLLLHYETPADYWH